MKWLNGWQWRGKGAEAGDANVRQKPWFKFLVSACGVLLVMAVCVEVYYRVDRYGTRLVEQHPVPACLEVRNAPAWLDPQITASLRDEAIAFATRDEATFGRAENVLDEGILREIAELYTGTTTVDGKAVSRQATGFNAWIKGVKEVRREVASDKSQQTIAVYAEWRTPAAWVRDGDALYLIDGDGVRLPGDYVAGDRAGSGLMVIRGVDLPGDKAPAPGMMWGSAEGGGPAADLAAGMKLAAALRKQRYVSQIDAVDVANFNGRKDPRGPWIVLATVWPSSAGDGPRVVQWGRPIGEEKYYEIQAAAKLKTLNELFMKYARIDANRDYVDIRSEEPKVPALADAPPARPARGT